MLKNTTDEGGQVRVSLRAHPIALTVIGVELGWLAISATRGGDRLGHDLRERVSGTFRGASERTRTLSAQLRERIMRRTGAQSEASPYPTEPAGHAHARHKSDEAMRHAKALSATAPRPDDVQGANAGPMSERQAGGRKRFARVLNGNPLLSLALGFMAGAGVGLALHHSPESAMKVGRPDQGTS